MGLIPTFLKVTGKKLKGGKLFAPQLPSHTGYGLKTKRKKIIKLSKTVEKSKISDFKPPAINPKTATKFSKPIKQTKTITQQSETAEKPNIVELKSVTIKQPKSTT